MISILVDDTKRKQIRRRPDRRSKSLSRTDLRALVYLVAGSILAISVIKPAVWVILPASVALLANWKPSVGMFCSVAAVALGLSFPSSSFPADSLAFVFLIVGGHLISRFGLQKTRVLAKVIGVYIVLGFVGFQSLRLLGGPEGGFMAWNQYQMGASFFPSFFSLEAWPEQLQPAYHDLMKPFFQNSLGAWFAVSLSVSLVFNLFLVRLLENSSFSGPKRSRQFWTRFSQWRSPDWILVPLVVGLACLALNYDSLFPAQLIWSVWSGWQLVILALFPALMGGLAFYSYLLPRVSFFVLMILLLLLFLNPLPILVLTGLGDIWFDFRRRMRSNPNSGSDENL